MSGPQKNQANMNLEKLMFFASFSMSGLAILFTHKLHTDHWLRHQAMVN